MKQLKVIQLIDSLNIGGAEMMAVNIANGLSEVGVISHLCVTRKEGALKNKLSNDVKYIFLNKESIIDIKSILKLKSYIRKNEIDLIHAHSSSFFLAGLIKILRPSIKICWQDHYGFSDDLENRNYTVLRLFSKLFCHIFSVNQKLKEWSINNLKTKNVSFLPNFANLTNEKITFLKGEKGKRMICLANLRPQKDHINLINAFNIFQKTHKNWTLHLVGEDNNTDYSKSIKKLIKDYNLTDDVFVYGSKSDVKHILSQATIGVLSSKSEGLPISLLEYGLVKLPVVCTDVGECASVVSHNFSGFIVSPKNHTALAAYLIKLAASTELQSKFGENLSINIINNYSEKSVINHIVKVYKNCLKIQNI